MTAAYSRPKGQGQGVRSDVSGEGNERAPFSRARQRPSSYCSTRGDDRSVTRPQRPGGVDQDCQPHPPSGTNGYGVGVCGGAHALIERNVFDYNRHAITSGREDGRVGYRAYRNLVLSNGTGDQQFDMHGSKGCTFLNIPDHWCGVAGHDFDVRYNSFVYTAGAAVLLRGTPSLGLPVGASMRFNVFAHDHDWDDAVKWIEGAPTVQDNLTGRKGYPPSSILCDFDGDGLSDTFIATEQTLWYCPGRPEQI